MEANNPAGVVTNTVPTKTIRIREKTRITKAYARPQFVAHHFGQTGSVLPQGNHAGQVVVYRPAEYASEHNPQISRRPVKDTQNRTEYRSRPGNVQKLDEIDFPRSIGV